MKFKFIGLLLLLTNFLFAQKMMSFRETKIPKPSIIDTSVTNFNKKQPFINDLNDFDKDFYYWINYSRKDSHQFFDSVIVPIAKIYPQLKGENYNSLKNDLLNVKELPLLVLNHSLINMAANQSKDITSHNISPSHISSNGNTFIDRFKAKNLKNCGAENISYGSGDPLFLIALLYLDINIPDLGHRKSLLNPMFTETGISSSYYKDGNIFLVEDFACPQH